MGYKRFVVVPAAINNAGKALGRLVGKLRRRLLVRRLRFERAVGSLLRPFLENASEAKKKRAAGIAVGLVHLVVLGVLLVGLRLHYHQKADITFVSLGGPIGPSTPRIPEFISPKLPTILPPFDESREAFQANTSSPQGSPNVTIPAEAISTEHSFPRLPDTLKSYGRKVVLLSILITEAGTVGEATVAESSGIRELDELAMSWVRYHWRYRPALQNGQPIAVSTTAIVILSA